MENKMFTALLIVWLPVVFARNLELTEFYRDVVMANKHCVDKPADIVFILDESRSIYYKDFHSQVNFVMSLAPRFNIDAGDIRIGVLTFSDMVNVRFNLGTVKTEDQMEVEMRKINSSQSYGDSTRTFDAIEVMTSDMFSSKYARDNVAHICVLITDGASSDFDSTAAKAEQARNAGITMIAIGVGKNLKKELNAIANDPDEEFVFEVDNFNLLDEIMTKLVEKTCTIITTTPPPTTTRAPSIEGCDLRDFIDVIFSLPDHAGIEGTNYAIEFINHFISSTNLGPVRVGVTPRLCYPANEIPLFAYDSPMDYVMALNQRKLITADVSEHINFIRTTGMFPNNDGGREDVHRFGILIVDSALSDKQQAINQARKAEQDGVYLIVIGVGEHVKMEELESIASDSESVFTVTDYKELQTAIVEVVVDVCKEMMNTNYGGNYDYPLK